MLSYNVETVCGFSGTMDVESLARTGKGDELYNALQSETILYSPRSILQQACLGPSVEIVETLLQKFQCPVDERTLCYAACNPKPKVKHSLINLLINHHKQQQQQHPSDTTSPSVLISAKFCITLAEQGDLPFLKMALEHMTRHQAHEKEDMPPVPLLTRYDMQ